MIFHPWHAQPVSTLALVVLLALASPLSAQGRGTLGLVVHKTEGFHNNFWDALQMGARKEATRLGYELDYRGVPVEDEGDRVLGQIRLMEEMVARGHRGILLTPLDRFRLAAAVKNTIVRGVPVVAVDSPVETTLLSAIVATDNYAGSLAGTKYFLSTLGPRAKVIMLAHPSRENKATRDREQAFLAGVKQFAPGVQVLSADRFGTATVEGDYQAALALLQDYPEVEGVYCVSSTGLIGFLKALEDKGLAGKVKLVGWDSDPASIAGLRNGRVQGIIQQNPERMGMEAVRQLHAALSGSPSRLSVDTGIVIVTRANLDQAEIRALINPNFGTWIR